MELGPPPLFNQGVPARVRLGILALLSIVLLVVDARLRALDAVRQGLEVVLYPLERALLWPRDAFRDAAGYLSSVASLTRENDQLRRAALEYADKGLATQQLQAENARLRSLLALRDRVAVRSTPVQVLYESRDRFTRKVVVDRGGGAGITAGSAVIDDAGVIGQVTRVYPLTAEVTLLTDKDQSIPVVVLRNGLRAVAYGGEEPGSLELRYMAPGADIVNGDVVATSGIDGVFPPGMPVARVERVERDAGEQFAHVVLRPVGGVDRHTVVLVLSVDDATRPPAPEPARPERGERDARKGARR
ncbi:MAG TPA: rod shape-determining protein MreC [Burkholderiaceae bacterium]|nr:rod shape-determining protein MreC [Burkholderiaceae bacterium]